MSNFNKNNYKKGLNNIFNKNLENLINDVEQNNILGEVVSVDLVKIKENPNQPRKQFNEKKLKELAFSIKENGLLFPILLKEDENNSNQYFLIAGERRLRAFKLLNIKSIPSIIKNVTDSKSAEFALIENTSREGLNKIEESLAYKNILEKNNWTHEELAKKINKSRSYVSNILRVSKLDEKILEALVINKISFGKVKMLINFEKEKQLNIFKEILSKNLNTRDVENLVKKDNKKLIRKTFYSNLLKQNIELNKDKLIVKLDNSFVLEKLKEILELD
ncbi:MAG: chromosome partitioning protein ParB [Candidatus Hepatoplasma vulgare]|nr:MAG: chromosome partitioning protein ParB [Candidatus Hepatoplasma sp.]